MSTQRYLRPVRETPDIGLDFLLARCAAVDGCLLWKGMMRNGPLTNINKVAWKVRHLVWNLTHGRAVKRGSTPMPTVCWQERCVHPDHLTAVKRNAHALGKKMTLLHRSHIAQAKRARNAKITPEQARDIQHSNETLTALAKRHGVSISTAHHIKAGTAWIDYSSPFAQLQTTVPTPQAQ